MVRVRRWGTFGESRKARLELLLQTGSGFGALMDKMTLSRIGFKCTAALNAMNPSILDPTRLDPEVARLIRGTV